jgi:hypothetical protein
MLRRTFLTTSGAVAVGGFGATALLGNAPDILLTVSGDVAGGSPKEYSDADLSALPQVSFTTSTMWTDGDRTFSGPTLLSLLDDVGAGPGPLRLTAVNNYAVTMPRDAIEPDAPIIATRIDGEPFNRRQNGPLWVVFPYDSDIRFQSEEVYAFSIWQLIQIEILSA